MGRKFPRQNSKTRELRANMIRIGVIGYGYWGPNLVRNFAEADGGVVTVVCDQRDERRKLVERRYPSIRTTADPNELINATDVDAVVIATPVSTHFDLAMAAINAGKHVFVEKPITTNSADADRLIEAADAKKVVLAVDHTFVFTGAVRKIRELIDKGELGELLYYDSVRINLGLFQRDVNVLWDLAVHDLGIMDFLLASKPVAVSATGMAHYSQQTENTAYLTLFFQDRFIAHLHANWLAPVKIRRTLLCGDKKMVVYDDLEAAEKIKVYDKGVTVGSAPDDVYRLLVGYRAGDMFAPNLDGAEALKLEANHFVECVAKNKKPLVNGQAGGRVVRILEAAEASMKKRGQPIDIRA